MYDFSKYDNSTPKQIVNTLSIIEKRIQKLNSQLKENNELFKFLQKKLKNSFNLKKTKPQDRRIPELDEAIREYEKGEVEVYDNFDEYKKAMDAL